MSQYSSTHHINKKLSTWQNDVDICTWLQHVLTKAKCQKETNIVLIN